MEPVAYKTKTGTIQYRPVMEPEEIEELTFDDEYRGFCLACGEEAYGVEPDARKYECESCGACKVYGYAELAVMGLLR